MIRSLYVTLLLIVLKKLSNTSLQAVQCYSVNTWQDYII